MPELERERGEFEKWAKGEIADHPLNMELCQNGCSGLGEHYEDFVTAWAYTAWLSSQQSTLRRVRELAERELQIAEQSVHPCSLAGLRNLVAAIEREFGRAEENHEE